MIRFIGKAQEESARGKKHTFGGRTPGMLTDRDPSQSFYSRTGYRMWGGERHVRGQANPYTLVSLGLVVGLAVAVATYFAFWT